MNTRKQIQKEVDALSKEMKDEGHEGMMKVSLDFGKDSPFKMQWASSKHWNAFGEKVKLISVIDYDDDINYVKSIYFKRFNVFIQNKN